MKCIINVFISFLLFHQFLLSSASAFIGISLVGGFGAALYAAFDKYLVCRIQECCTEKIDHDWIRANISKLENDLQKKVHGQAMANSVIVRALKSHLKNDQPTKALVMSFHGWTGSGKNHVSKIIADSVYKLGMKSQYVHLIVTTLSFPHETESDIYKLQIQDWIRGNVSACSRSLFIFDEIDKMPSGMIDAIKPFIDYHEAIFGIDFRKSMFIFLSNTGSRQIIQRTMEIWRQGRERSSITLEDMEDLVQLGAFNEKGGLHNSELIQHSLVDHYIPFLPLTKNHIVLCINDELDRQGFTLGREETKEVINKVVESMSYFPPENQLFSTSGCKRVATKLSYVLSDKIYDSLFD